jgi:FecR protein
MFKPRWLSILLAFPLLLTLNSQSAGDVKRPKVVGSIAGIKGSVWVNHLPVLDKGAIFSGEVVSTGASSGAYLNLRGTVAILVENSELALTGSGEAATMALKKGALEVRSGKLQPAQIYLGKASVVVRNDGDFPSICRIASVGKSSVVIADRGRVEIHGSGVPLIVLPGKSVHLEAGVPQAAGQLAGSVSGEIPTATVQRGGTGNANSLKLKDPVYWQDLVETQGNGRVRIALAGGSFLNVGARSQMRIVQHDAQSQQTSVELKLGTLRGEVVKLTKGGSKFETRTPTAVIGVVGTIYAANATPQDTGVWSVTGDVTVRNIDPNVPGTVVLHTGQFTHVGLGVPPTSPTTPPSSQMQSELQNTDVQEGGLAGATAAGSQAGTGGGTAGAGSQGAAAAPGISTGITNGLTLGAVGVAVGTGAVALSEISKAKSNVASAQSNLADAGNANSQAMASAAAAAAAASSAQSAAQQANDIVTTIANQVNGLLQGCGCVSPSGP